MRGSFRGSPIYRISHGPARNEGVNIFLDFGFVWVPGYYDHDHGRYKWVAGRWEHERKGYAYHGATWEHRSGHWYYTEPGWRREHSPG